MESLERYLAEHRFFAGLAPEYLPILVGCAKNVRFEEGQRLFDQGNEARSFFLIRQGQVALELSAPGMPRFTTSTCSEGSVVGWSWLIGPHRWRYTGRATERVLAIEMDGVCMRNKCEDNHDFGYEVMKRFSGVMAHRLEATRLQLLDVYGAEEVRR